jgi:hypothetical protein
MPAAAKEPLTFGHDHPHGGLLNAMLARTVTFL